MVQLYSDLVLQGMRFRVGCLKGVLGSGLIMVHLYFDFVLQGVRFRVD
jgi:hypothetical protein